MKGVFITLEGIEGSGKTTQVQFLKSRLENLKYRVLATREPGGSRIAEIIRGILLDNNNREISPMTELLLYEAARAQHVDEVIRPALESGAVVISDRFVDSTTAYQGAGRSIDIETVQVLHRIATRDVWPDMTIVLDVPVKEGLGRIGKCGKPDRIEQEPESFHAKVRESFLELSQKEPNRVKIVDGCRSPLVIAEDIFDLIKPLLSPANLSGE